MGCLNIIQFGAQLVDVGDETSSVPLTFAVEAATSAAWTTCFFQLSPEGLHIRWSLYRPNTLRFPTTYLGGTL